MDGGAFQEALDAIRLQYKQESSTLHCMSYCQTVVSEEEDMELHLRPLKCHIAYSEECTFTGIEVLIAPLFHTLCLIWIHSKYYCVPPRIILVQEFCNLVIERAFAYLIPEELFKMEVEEGIEKVQQTIQTLKSFRKSFTQRQDEPELFASALNFLKLENIELGGSRGKILSEMLYGMNEEFHDRRRVLRERKYDPLDYGNLKLFDNLADLKFKENEVEGDMQSTIGTYSREGEYVPFSQPCVCEEQVRLHLEETMRSTVRKEIMEAVAGYEDKPQDQWLFDYPAQMALTGSQIWWATDVGIALERLEDGFETALKDYSHKQITQLNALINLLLGDLTPVDRQKIMTTCTIDVYARDVVAKLIAQKDNYDWGLRVIKSALAVAGDRNRPEDQLLVGLMCSKMQLSMKKHCGDFNLPKIVTNDVPIFLGLISDLFPLLDVLRKRDLDSEQMTRQSVAELRLQPEENFILKLLTARLSVFIVGNAGAGKSQVLTLASNERISLTSSMRLLFEISHSSGPATVSRADILYVSPQDWGWSPEVCSWIDTQNAQTERANLAICMVQTILVYTSETICLSYFVDLILDKGKPVTLVGNAGIGKTILISEKVSKLSEDYMVAKVMLQLKCRISRILEAPHGNALLIGVGGSGKQSLCRLAAFLSVLEVFQITLRKGYGIHDLKRDIAAFYMKVEVKNIGTVFLSTDAQIPEERFLVLINDMLASGDVPDLFSEEEVDCITASIRMELRGLGVLDTGENCWQFFIDRICRQLKVEDLKAMLAIQEVELHQRNKDMEALIAKIEQQTEQLNQDKAIADAEEQRVDDFLEALIHFDKEHIPEGTVRVVKEEYLWDPDFNPEFVWTVLCCCRALRLGYQYNMLPQGYFKIQCQVYCEVELKRRKLSQVSMDLADTAEKLEELDTSLATLTAAFEKAIAEKIRCQDEVNRTNKTIELANRLVKGLASENVRWVQCVAQYHEQEQTLCGDVLPTAAFISWKKRYR
ncbi:UNVERIFIED_CONTAM: hypothetical protein FKN15_039182 [Acipenser sinensis]